MDPHSPTGARGGCKRAGATGTRRLCEAPGGPSFSEKSRTESPRWLAALNRGRGPRWCPRPSFRPLFEATQGEEAWGGGGDGDRLGGWEAAAWIPAHRKRSGRAGRKGGWGRREGGQAQGICGQERELGAQKGKAGPGDAQAGLKDRESRG